MTDDVQILISATLEFREAAGTPKLSVTTESNVALDKLIDAIPGAKTIEMGYGGNSRTVQLPENQVDALKKALGSNYTTELARSMRINL